MKTILSTLLFFFVTQFTFAQIVATAHVISDSQSMKTKPAISAKRQAKMANSQNQMVIAELSSFIQKELKYSDVMTENEQIQKRQSFMIGGGLIFALLGFLAYRFNKIRKERNDKKAFTEALIFAQEEERKRIARDLHDGVSVVLRMEK